MPNWWILQWDNDKNRESKDSQCFIFKKFDEMANSQSKFKPYWKHLGKYKALFIIKNIFKHIKFKKEIEDKWNQIDHDFYRRLIDSVKQRTKIWISLEGALAEY